MQVSKTIMSISSDIENSFENMCNYISQQKESGKSVALCHGCFDPLHLGHVMHFEAARKIADIVIVTVTPDIYVNKGKNRPYFNHYQRKYWIDSIRHIDMCAINLWDDAVETIKRTAPTYFVKGSEYKDSTHLGFLLEKQAIEKLGGTVYYTDTKKYSSTELITNGYFHDNIL